MTRAEVETTVLRVCGKWLTAVGLDGTTTNGTNPDIGIAIASALRALRLTVSNPTSPSDADIALVSDARLDLFLSIVLLRAIQAAIRNCTDVTTTHGIDKQDLSDLADRMQKEAASLAKELADLYGYGKSGMRGSAAAPITAGTDWPPGPPPPNGPAPYPQTANPQRTGQFNP